ncbi:MAG: tandem-95 repeat protein [Fluviicola sp.]|nr:tandem-95 repeat protein [Fluviicola sp.]
MKLFANVSSRKTINLQICRLILTFSVVFTAFFSEASIDFQPPNTPPTTGNESLTVDEDALPVTINNLLSNNFDADGDSLNVVYVTGSVSGTFIYNYVTGSILYYTAPDFCGVDTIVYGVSDGFVVVEDTLFLTLNCINDAPNSGSEVITMDEDGPTITTPDLLSNNTDVEGDPLTIGATTGPFNGTVSNNANGTFDYTPNPNWCGVDTMYYEVSDGMLITIDTLFIVVNCINDIPVGGNENLVVNEDSFGTTTSGLLDNDSDIDGDILTILTTSGPSNGVISINANGTLTYTPNPDFCGSDTVTYVVTDGIEVIVDTVFITITCINDIPTGGDELIYVDLNSDTLNVDILGNNTDVETVILVVSSPVFPFTTNQGGTVTINSDGTINYSPMTDFEGLDTLEYVVCDDNLPVPGCVTDIVVFVVSTDSDMDGVVNYYDLDDDNDGTSDYDELITSSNNGDTDSDGIPDNLDLDSDNDGIFDIAESAPWQNDADKNGVLDNFTDVNNNGWDDFWEMNWFPSNDTDGDGRLDFQDPDDDGDGILTIDEYDENEDGIIDNCDNDDSFNYLDSDPCEIIIPQVFSPNFDEVNDVFEIQGIYDYPNSKLQIFNRWGNLVYSSDNYQNNWNGRSEAPNFVNNDELPVGSYFYVFELSDGRKPMTGYIYLTR